MRGPLQWLRDLWESAEQLNRDRDLARAARLRKRGSYAESRAILEAVLARFPGDSRAGWQLDELKFAPEFDRAEALYGEGQAQEAEEILERLIQTHPGEPEPHLRFAPMLVERGASDDAAEHAACAAELGWDDPSTVYRAASLARWGDPEASKRYLSHVEQLLVARGSEERFPFRVDVWHLEGLLAWQDGDGAVALDRFQRAFAAEPDGVGHGADLALVLAQHGRRRDALDVLARALEHRPGDERLLEVQEELTHDSQ